MEHMFALLTDIAIGLAAIKVAWSADKAAAQIGALLKELTMRVERLEDYHRPAPRVVKRRKPKS